MTICLDLLYTAVYSRSCNPHAVYTHSISMDHVCVYHEARCHTGFCISGTSIIAQSSHFHTEIQNSLFGHYTIMSKLLNSGCSHWDENNKSEKHLLRYGP